jgi:hypothetical protein
MSLDYTPKDVPTRKARKYSAEERQCWKTPNTIQQPVLQLVATALGGEIGLDPTSDDAMSVPAYNHITIEKDCFETGWFVLPGEPKTAFMNCPFDNPHLFLEEMMKAVVDYGEIDEAIALLKAGTIHNKKTGTLIRQNASVICHWGAGKVGRIGFIDHEGYQVKGSDFDCVLVYFGENEDRFNDVFRHWGTLTRILYRGE